MMRGLIACLDNPSRSLCFPHLPQVPYRHDWPKYVVVQECNQRQCNTSGRVHLSACVYALMASATMLHPMRFRCTNTMHQAHQAPGSAAPTPCHCSQASLPPAHLLHRRCTAEHTENRCALISRRHTLTGCTPRVHIHSPIQSPIQSLQAVSQTCTMPCHTIRAPSGHCH